MFAAFLTREAHLITLTRALRFLKGADLLDVSGRERAYRTAGIVAWSADDDEEALSRSKTYWQRIVPAAAAALQTFADAKIQQPAVLA